MKHGISDEDWDDFLSGRGAAHIRARIDAHLIVCVQCWELYRQELPAMRLIAGAAAEAREKLAVPSERLQSMLTAFAAGVRSEDDSTRAQIRNGLDFLRSILVPVFGPHAAQSAMLLAANECAARSLDRITRESWNVFLERLAAMISIICGDVFAGLIREHGRLAAAGL